MSKQSLANLVPLLESTLGIEPGFFESLDGEDENDWSFVIKVHALIEAHLTLTHRTPATTRTRQIIFAPRV
jgi:hypothetical protein